MLSSTIACVLFAFTLVKVSDVVIHLIFRYPPTVSTVTHHHILKLWHLDAIIDL